jgi:hypothetical protein
VRFDLPPVDVPDAFLDDEVVQLVDCDCAAVGPLQEDLEGVAERR